MLWIVVRSVEQFSSWHISSQFCGITLQSVTARLIESSKRAFFCQRRQIAGSACGSRMHFVILSQILKNIQNSRGKNKNDSRRNCATIIWKWAIIVHAMILITLFFIFSSNPVPGPPRSIKAVVSGPGSVVVSWLPPDRPNGLLVQVFINFFILMGIQMTDTCMSLEYHIVGIGC